MKIRSIVGPFLIAFVLLCSPAFGKKEAKEYMEGTVVEVTTDKFAGSTTASRGGLGDECRMIYTIEGKDGEYAAREMGSSSLFKPLDVSEGDKLQFRVHPKGRFIYVPLPRGEKILEVVKFNPK